MIAVVTMKELGFIKSNTNYTSFLPCPLSPSGESVLIVAHALHLDKKIKIEAVCEYILGLSKEHSIPAVAYGIILCKFHVALSKKNYTRLN